MATETRSGHGTAGVAMPRGPVAPAPPEGIRDHRAFAASPSPALRPAGPDPAFCADPKSGVAGCTSCIHIGSGTPLAAERHAESGWTRRIDLTCPGTGPAQTAGLSLHRLQAPCRLTVIGNPRQRQTPLSEDRRYGGIDSAAHARRYWRRVMATRMLFGSGLPEVPFRRSNCVSSCCPKISYQITPPPRIVVITLPVNEPGANWVGCCG